MKIFLSLDGTDIMAAERPVCMALGLFDGLHTGHMRVIGAAVEKARAQRLKSCVFTFSMGSSSPAGKMPALNLLSSGYFADILTAAGVDYIVKPDFAAFKDMLPQSFIADVVIRQFGAGYISCGEDFRFGKSASASGRDIRRLGGDSLETQIIPMLSMDDEIISSSKIRFLIEKGDIPKANKMLGRRFSIDFEVVHGRELGRSLNAPTINQPFPDTFVIPRFGVYATLAYVGGKCYSAVTNVGVKPTVGSDGPLAETYIHDYSGDLYGKSIRVDFISFLRPEIHFSGIDELKAQISLDSECSKKIYKQGMIT